MIKAISNIKYLINVLENLKNLFERQGRQVTLLVCVCVRERVLVNIFDKI